MSENPRVTVLMPTLNASQYLREALTSIFDQTYQDFEILMVDDGSSDGTIDIAESFDDERLRLVRRNSPSGGIPGALNRGLELARGEYVARHDADDRSLPERFQRQVSFLDEERSVSMVGTSAHLLNADGTRTETRIVQKSPTFDDLLDKNRFIHGSVMFRTDAVTAIGGYDTAVTHAEDYDLWLRLANESVVRNLPDPLYELRVHEDSVYGDTLRAVKLHAAFARLRVLGETTMAANDLRDHSPEFIYDHLSRKDKLRLHRELAQEYLRYGRSSDARNQCRSALGIQRFQPIVWCLLLLSYTPRSFVEFTIALYRRILNRRARHHSA